MILIELTMARNISLRLCLLFIGILCCCVRAHMPVFSKKGGDLNDIHHQEIARNKDHIREHLDYLDEEQMKNITERETEFLFFNTHDYNQDKHLDGLEILSSLLHIYTEEHVFGAALEESDLVGKSEEEVNEIRKIRNSQILDYASGVLDNILAFSDSNDDGYIDYVEYSHARELEMIGQEVEHQQQQQQQE